MNSISVKYPDGTSAKVGDRVIIDHGAFTGQVKDVIDSSEKQANWGVQEFGLMIDASNSGLTFWSTDSIVRDKIELDRKMPA